jgi:hypothetical protein
MCLSTSVANRSAMGIARMIERAGEVAKLPFPVHVHMLRHSTGYALAGRGMDTRRLHHYLGHASITNTLRYAAMSPEPQGHLARLKSTSANGCRLGPSAYRLLRVPCTDGLIDLSVRCMQPIQQHGRRIPSMSSEHTPFAHGPSESPDS